MGFLGTILGAAGTVFTGNPAFLAAGASFDKSKNAKGAAGGASAAQSAAAQAGIDQNNNQLAEIQKLLQPYISGGGTAYGGQQDILGLNGADKQGAAIAGIQGSPQFASLLEQGENSILSNASATGGLRGGNTQAALAQFSPALLSQLIDQQYGRLGGLSAMGLSAAGGLSDARFKTGVNISNLLTQQGAAQAGGILGKAKADNDLIAGISNGFGMFKGLGGGL